ncbi:hypothetical protein CQA66_05650 [Helicobacter aurati]|uniref:Transporter n=1 Tax=Helicobacter aurati TaxID=137778 RepID=A0A3D8J3Y8_9HELI|nr:outer membrane protein transport protein [Helicobacter aurati]RDU71946.1 hypothetical protein CQA66_05650 [Helicobacter aurati]
MKTNRIISKHKSTIAFLRVFPICIVMLFLLTNQSGFSSGFRLTEQSLNGTALNSAFIAGAYGADSTYYNPANMSLGQDNENYEFEINGTLIFIAPFTFDTENRDKGINVEGSGITGALAAGHYCGVNGKSQQTTGAQPNPNNVCGNATVSGHARATFQPVPKFFFKSRSFKLSPNLRANYGISFTTPSGLSMQWDGEGGGFLRDVSIAMLEFNPVVSVAWRDFLAIGGGFRAIYTFGEFNNTLYVPFRQTVSLGVLGSVLSYGTTKVEQTSDASAWGFGYNLAATIKPFALFDSEAYNSIKDLSIAVTYRSNVHLDMNGKLSAKSYVFQGKGITLVEGYIGMDAHLTLGADVPPILNVAIAKDFGRQRVEFVYERTFWGSAQIFEFTYANQIFDKSNLTGSQTALGQINPEEMLAGADYSAVAYGNGWKDSNAYRLGYTYFGKSYKVMGSLAYDETPAPQGQFGIPDANAYMFGLGYRKKLFDDKLDIGIAYSLALKDNRKSFIVSRDGFGQLHLLTIGAKLLW